MAADAAMVDHWQAMLGRLRAGEPLRLLIGERLYAASELVMTPAFTADLRGDLIADIDAHLAELVGRPDPDNPGPAAPAAAAATPEPSEGVA